MKPRLVRSGFTMIELLVVLVILSILLITGVVAVSSQRLRGMDARRKSDLAHLKTVFEDYYNDKSCYPPITAVQHCGGSDLSPYMAKVPCDPQTNQPYGYIVDSSCRWYGLFSTLTTISDPAIAASGCNPTCGVTGQPYNYSALSGNVTLSQVVVSYPTGGVVPTAGVSSLACDPSGQCNLYQDPQSKGCPFVFTDAQACQAACSYSAYRCSQ